MGRIGPRRVEVKPIKGHCTVMDDGLFHPVKSGEWEDAFAEKKGCGGTVPCEEVDALDTQVVNFDDETQPVDDFFEETQVMDLAGETQVMDDYELVESMDTQVLDVSDEDDECENNYISAERTQVLDDEEEVPDRQNDAKGDERTQSCEDDDTGVKLESLAPKGVAQSSGCLKRGFASVRTASLRAAALAARKLSLKNAGIGSCSSAYSEGSAEIHLSNDQGAMSNFEAVGVEDDSEKVTDDCFSDGKRSKVARSLARKLFVEDDDADEETMGRPSGERTVLPAFDVDIAGLSYADSQEPGELSQANALDFVDRFLKITDLDSDQNITHAKAVGDVLSTHAVAKGPQSLARQAMVRSAGHSAFDWDDCHEDEGGGEFFVKKKEQLFGTTCGNERSSKRSRHSKKHEPSGSKSTGKLKTKEEEHTISEKITPVSSSDSKLVERRRGCREKSNIGREIDNFPDQELVLNSFRREVTATAPDSEHGESLNVGIDTQMAAEAMEALSTGTALVAKDGNNEEQNGKEGRACCRREVRKDGFLKPSSMQRKPCPSTSAGVTTLRSRKVIGSRSDMLSKSSIALRTRSQCAAEYRSDDLVNSKAKRKRSNMKTISSTKEKKSCDLGHKNSDGKEQEAIEGEELNFNGSLPVNRRSSLGKAETSRPVAQKTRKSVAGDGERSKLVEAVSLKRKLGTSGDDPECSSAKGKTLNQTANKDAVRIDGSTCKRDLLNTCYHAVQNGSKHSPSRVYEGHELIFESVARRTRSRSRGRCSAVPRNAEGLCSRAALSSKITGQSPFKKQKAAKGRLPLAATSPGEVPKSFNSDSVNATPTSLNSLTPKNAASPICMGDECPTLSCKSLKRELYQLTCNERRKSSPFKDLRQRRDMSSVRVLLSKHLDADVVKQLKKVSSRLGVSTVSAMSDATHFIADTFVRTRNMSEAIANGKPVVTHFWLESCGQASSFIDEKNYILRDIRKERELGFSMPETLARANRHPLLEGKRVLFTQNVKPSKEIISSLVIAVHGQAMERLCRSTFNNDKLPDDLLVLSCEEDFEDCLPLLEKGTSIYSSELLLSGIITQRLEYERYCLFTDHVKKTRTTLWLKNGDRFLSVPRNK